MEASACANSGDAEARAERQFMKSGLVSMPASLGAAWLHSDMPLATTAESHGRVGTGGLAGFHAAGAPGLLLFNSSIN